MSETVQAIPPFVDAPAPFTRRRQAARPTAREWRLHIALFFLTAITSSLAWVMFNNAVEPDIQTPAHLADYVAYIPRYFIFGTLATIQNAFAHPFILAQGLTFAAALLFILASHEAGHYIACRRYGVDATLPFFIPAPPLFVAGTFGAFIKIKSPIPSRRALFDIGLAGPIAGFIVALPIAVIGILQLQPMPPVTSDAIVFNDPLLFRLIERAFNIRLSVFETAPNPLQFAAWIGLLVTSLNLMPVGQLDGGHATYAVFGKLAHKWIGRAAFITMAVLAVLGWFLHGSPSGLLYTVLLGIMLRVRHPQIPDETQPLGRARTIIAILTLVIFALSFLPFPISII